MVFCVKFVTLDQACSVFYYIFDVGGDGGGEGGRV